MRWLCTTIRWLFRKRSHWTPVVGVDVGREETTFVTGETKDGEVRFTDHYTIPTDRDLLGDEERAIWADLEGGPPKHQPIVYPPKGDLPTQDWVTARLTELTGGMTRHPYDRTDYPTPPTEADQAARQYAQTNFSGPRALFTHGYSMRYLYELKARADRKDMSLTAEELMGLRARGIT